MPSKPKRSCSVAGCPRLVVQGRCPQHALPRPVDTRPSSTQRGYGSHWRQTRGRYLTAFPFCAVCGTIATDVDHKLSRAKGGTDAWENLQSLCRVHHSQKTAREDGGLGNKVRAI